MRKVFVIAEAGVNHNGSVELAKKMIDAAAGAEADAVKFQTFKAENVISRFAQKAEYQKQATGAEESQLEMVKKLELSQEAFRELFNYCGKKDIIFMSTPFDEESVDFLNRLGVSIFKIPSGEVTNLPYLRKIGSLRKKIIMSTGMADLKEIEKALNVLIEAGTPKEHITILHCNTEYPTPFEDVNLLAMLTIRNTLGVTVGYSDHTSGIELPIAAVALGAAVLEKHFTLDKTMEGPDHKASVEPGELKEMIKAIRNIEKALGSGVKKPSPSEVKNKIVARRSIVAARPIKKGELLAVENIMAKRPAGGISPMEWDSVIGKIAKRDFGEDEVIEL